MVFEAKPVKLLELNDILDLKKAGVDKRIPLLIRDVDIGPCRTKWTVPYLSEKLSNVNVKVHVSIEKSLSFIEKNFVYKTLPFPEFLKRASGSGDEWFFSESESYYLRSIGVDKRGKDVANIHEHFPEITDDLKIPDLVSCSDYFSSVLRISSEEVQIWTHYDVMDNILIQIVGEKRVVLFPPSDIHCMYLNGDKSEVLDIDNPNLDEYPDFTKAQRFECTLLPGDVLFIPALWFHNTIAKAFSIGVNVFWRHLNPDLYDKSDVYGNKDPLPAAKALSLVKKAIQELEKLPSEYQDFYSKRLVIELEKFSS